MNPSSYKDVLNFTNTTTATLGTSWSIARTPNLTQEAEPAMDVNMFMKAFKLTLYAIIFLISAMGNVLVCIIILKRRKMKTVTNYFILNLALADLTLTLICIPFDIPVQEMNYRWPYGSFMCRILYPLQTMSLFASVFTLTAVSLTRYWAILYPLRRQLTTTTAKSVIAIIWLLSLIPVSPYISVLRIDETGICNEHWGKQGNRKIYTVALFIAQYAVPLSIIAAAYVSIGRELGRKNSDGLENKFLQNAKNEEATKVIRMLVAVTILFAVCVLPTNVMWLWLDFDNADQHFPQFWEVVAFCNILTFSNSAANPVCYLITNANYRKEFARILKRCFLTKKKRWNLQPDELQMLETTELNLSRRENVLNSSA
ncbi:QRFP-like peptide receptor [Acropora millepora]|uniref:QRFP-like peptide receptor n=1 Tax=Acropora millepora TaxID=45264 RepID=UPI001CF14837|nr:QRFP-like peptide receptor [Acropora millepora]XP_029186247.2 QRFP-like peptide receptor [Acropora millepora]XP_029186248.2 QRFP-like peptide receptor [Acropora millepora]XP_029186249.2 QRFP-like peptide receptor [Acropora millepora]XP_029186252.2 QRFP-like peptide receptor [Acropora millepora]XP_029186253.2 QRFP-like peptide receptor [Acropora millepora]XP_029186254.2 QRFP-like peptide receptor [Acropora millepora]XP_029186255.2 QRFP-like peptide receptor [Acropora millepora]XP_02918625